MRILSFLVFLTLNGTNAVAASTECNHAIDRVARLGERLGKWAATHPLDSYPSTISNSLINAIDYAREVCK